MASVELSRRVGKVVGYPRSQRFQRREFQEALFETAGFKDLPGKWQAVILKVEQNGPELRLVGRTQSHGGVAR